MQVVVGVNGLIYIAERNVEVAHMSVKAQENEATKQQWCKESILFIQMS